MRAMILAAGRGERMGALTESTPKPLIQVKGQCLIEYGIKALVKAKVTDLIINVSYHADMIKAHLGNGERFGASITYSEETNALETGGGVFKALPLLGPEPFIVMSADIISDYNLKNLPQQFNGSAHIVLVPNPDFNAAGDFGLAENLVSFEPKLYTYANIGVFAPGLFNGCQSGKFKLAKLLKKEIENNNVTGEVYKGFWNNLGTAQQVQELNLAPS